MPTLTRVDCDLPLPIPHTARQVAERFAVAQPTPAKAIQVRLNTLAVWAVKDYLQLMDVATDIARSDSWNPVMQLSTDTADLLLPGIGSIECRPMLPESTLLAIPPEVRCDRIGYFVVRIANNYREATILGFVPRITQEWLSLDQLQPPEALFDHLELLRIKSSMPEFGPVQLSQWLRGQFTSSWQSVESLLEYWEPGSLCFSFRGRCVDIFNKEDCGKTVRRAKVIDLGILLNNQPLALIVAVTPVDPQSTTILIQVAPTSPRCLLPPALQLQVRDESEILIREVQARNADNYMQLKLHGHPGEHFRVQISLGDAYFDEVFLI